MGLFTIGGFFKKGDFIRYRRTIAEHDYFGMKFMVLLFNWNSQSSLKIEIGNEDNEIIATRVLNGSDPMVMRADNDAQCNGKKYRKYSISLEIF